jgi:hypothetical protein
MSGPIDPRLMPEGISLPAWRCATCCAWQKVPGYTDDGHAKCRRCGGRQLSEYLAPAEEETEVEVLGNAPPAAPARPLVTLLKAEARSIHQQLLDIEEILVRLNAERQELVAEQARLSNELGAIVSYFYSEQPPRSISSISADLVFQVLGDGQDAG